MTSKISRDNLPGRETAFSCVVGEESILPSMGYKGMSSPKGYMVFELFMSQKV